MLLFLFTTIKRHSEETKQWNFSDVILLPSSCKHHWIKASVSGCLKSLFPSNTHHALEEDRCIWGWKLNPMQILWNSVMFCTLWFQFFQLSFLTHKRTSWVMKLQSAWIKVPSLMCLSSAQSHCWAFNGCVCPLYKNIAVSKQRLQNCEFPKF